jgi:ATP-dependent exoDNAse (exonuclease V) beta subunit
MAELTTKPDTDLCATTTRTAVHPRTGVTITFTFATHRYSTPKISHFTSGTTFVKHFFTPFNSTEVASRCAAKRGVSVESLLAEWEAKRNESALCGTRTHETCEAMLRGEPFPHTPRQEHERLMFSAGYNAVTMLRERGFVFHAAEQIVFSEKLVLAGMIDLLMFHPETGVAWILDWKTNETIDWKNPYQRVPKLIPGTDVNNPLTHLPDCNAVHYSLQLSLYQYLLVTEGYISANARIERALIHLTEAGPVWIPIPYLQQEIMSMIPAFWECPF